MSVLHVLAASFERAAAQPDVRRWLARGDRLADAHDVRRTLLREQFRFDGETLPAAALRHACRADAAREGTWLAADPAWVRTEATGARLMAWPLADVAPDEAAALSATLQSLFADSGMALVVDTPAAWCLRVPDGTAGVAFTAPGDALGVAMLECLPSGDAGRAWRKLFTEVQVVLHAHPVNAARLAAGRRPVNALWFWGAGRLPARIGTSLRVVASADDVLNGLATTAGAARVAVSPDAVANAGEAGDALVDLDAPQFTDALATWLPHCARWLRAHRFDAIELTFAGGERFRVRHAHRLRWWRRAS